jgi:hypothetical protein
MRGAGNEAERGPGCPELTAEQRRKVAGALDRNNSDVDFCEFRGRTLVYYGKGNQQGPEFLAESAHDVSLTSFLEGFCPPPRS